MTRILGLNPENLTSQQKTVYNKIVSGPRGKVSGPLAVWLRRPILADKAQSLGKYCRFDSSLHRRQSELAILVTAQIWSAEYEWEAHVVDARKAGVENKIIEAIKNGQEPIFDKIDEAVIYRLTRQLNLEREISDSIFVEAEKVLGQGKLIDLIGLLGYYSLISMTINAFKIKPDYSCVKKQNKDS